MIFKHDRIPVLNLAREQAQQKIAELAEPFNEHIEEYKRGNYNKEQIRVDYTNPFFQGAGPGC